MVLALPWFTMIPEDEEAAGVLAEQVRDEKRAEIPAGEGAVASWKIEEPEEVNFREGLFANAMKLLVVRFLETALKR